MLGDEAFDAYKKIQRLVGVSERSTKGLRERLDRDGFSPEAIEEALGRAVSYGIVDDRRYAEAPYARIRAGKGRRGIESELRDLGIDPDEIDETEIERRTRWRAPSSFSTEAPPQRTSAMRRIAGSYRRGIALLLLRHRFRIWSESL